MLVFFFGRNSLINFLLLLLVASIAFYTPFEIWKTHRAVAVGSVVNLTEGTSAYAQNWLSIASSADGTKLAAVGNGNIWTSVDSGATWVNRTEGTGASGIAWQAITSSEDGTKLAAVDHSDYDIWTSSDSGVTWTNKTTGTGVSGGQWQAITSSADGTKLTVVENAGDIWTSSDSGTTWTNRTTGTDATNQPWYSVAASSDGAKLVAIVFGGSLWVSTDSGVTWVQGTGLGYMSSVASSADGSKLAIAVSIGDLWTSSDSGSTWVDRTEGTSGSGLFWISIASSADGTKLAAVSLDGHVWTSSNGGETWVDRIVGTGAPAGSWYAITSSADGTKLVASAFDNLWAITQDFTPPVISNTVAITSADSVTINWDTDSAADSLVHIGTSTGAYSISNGSSDFVTNHSVFVDSLSCGRTYHYQIVSNTQSGGEATTTDESFNTAACTPGQWYNMTEGTSAAFQAWQDIASSADGNTLIATIPNGDIWTSIDAGATWNNQTLGTLASGQQWYPVAVSADGTKAVAAANAGDLWTSSDSGVTWTNQTEGTEASGQAWTFVSSSQDGTKLAATAYAGDIWTSIDSGLSWSNQTTGTSASGQSWISITTSADGTKLAAGAVAGDIWTSTDSGATWSNSTINTPASGNIWKVTSTADGETIIAAATFGDIWISDDAGASWNNKTRNTQASGGTWVSITASADGTKIAAAAQNHDIWMSVDAGDTWFNQTVDTEASGQQWFQVAASADGSAFAGVQNADIWRTTLDFVAPLISTIEATTTDTSATISWSTDLETDSYVRLGATTAYGVTVENATFTTSHELVKENLACGTTYHYQIISHTRGGGEATSTDQTVTTAACVLGHWYNLTQSTDASGLYWHSIASSADGTKLAAVMWSDGDGIGNIWTSTDSGATWINQTEGTSASGKAWKSVTSSNDGTKLAAVVYGGDIWTSGDSGLTWSNQTEGTEVSGMGWTAITSSANGTKLAAVADDPGDIWTSTDSGVTWTNQTTGTGASGQSWSAIASSLDGSNLVAVSVTGVGDSGYIWTSTDSGVTWTNQTTGTIAAAQNWRSVTSSADGTKLAAVVGGGDIWASTDSGATWVNQTKGTSATNLNWTSITSSQDGTRLAATDGVFNSVWISVDSGLTWVDRTVGVGNGVWTNVVASADLTQVFAITDREDIWRASFNFTPSNISSANVATTDSSATFTWTTDAQADTFVRFGITTAYTQAFEDLQVATDHTATVERLICDTTYHYRLISHAASGAEASTTDQTFTTDPCVAGHWYSMTPGTSASGQSWSKLVSSLDGTKLAAIAGGYDIWTSTDSGATWINRTENTPASGQSWLSITSSADGTKLAALVGFGGDIWTSTDSGVTWTNQTTGTDASGQNWRSITSSQDGTKLAAVALVGDIWTSTDSGVTWTNQTEGTSASSHSWGSIVSSADGTILAAGVAQDGDGTIWTSSDSGVTWTEQLHDSGFFPDNALAASADGRVLAMANNNGNGGVYISKDFGVTWSDISPLSVPDMGAGSIALSADGTKLWVSQSNDGDIWMSADSGETWLSQTVNSDASGQDWRSITSSGDGTLVGAMSSRDIWHAENDFTAPVISNSTAATTTDTTLAISWSTDRPANALVRFGTSDAYGQTVDEAAFTTDHTLTAEIRSLCGVTYHYQIVAHTVAGGVATSTDQTFSTPACAPGTWYNLTTGTGAAGIEWQAVAASQDGTKLAAIHNSGSADIWTSNDSGTTWTNQTTGTAASGQWWFSITSSADGSKLAAVAYNADIWTSSDYGVTWTNQTTGTGASGQPWYSIASSADGSTLVAVVSNGDIWASSDSGVTWANQTTGTGASGSNWVDVTISPDGTTMTAAAYGGDIWVSIDSGATWENKTQGTALSQVGWQAVAASSNGTVLAAADSYDGGVYVSVDAGATWNFSPINMGATKDSLSMSTDGSKIVVASGGLGGHVYISVDYGATWTDLSQNSNMATQYAYALAMTPDATKLIAPAGDIYSEISDIWTTTLDFTPPVISAVDATTTDSSATFAWTTDVATDATVRFGTSDAYGRLTTGDTDPFVTNHSITLNNLMCGTTYHYQIVSHTLAGGEATTTDATLTTSACVPGTWYNVTAGTSASNANFSRIVASAGGTKLAALAQNDDIWTSNDSGVTWTNRTTGTAASGQSWTWITSSADGTKLAATAQFNQDIWVSTDSGATWTNQTTGTDAANQFWGSVTASADGSKLVAVSTADYGASGDIWTSTDSGTTWINQTEGTDASGRNWFSVAGSSDGTKLAAAEVYGGLWTSTDSGLTWVQRTINENKNWRQIVSSADGTRLVATELTTNDLWVSTDSGVTWAPKNLGVYVGEGGLGISADGSKIVAVDSDTGYAHLSVDGGESWVNISALSNLADKEMISIAASATGAKLVASVYDPDTDTTDLWTTTLDFIPPVISTVEASTTDSAVSVTWATDLAADSYIRFGTADTYGRVVQNTDLLTSHILTQENLMCGTTYHYQIVAHTSTGGEATTTDATFTTTACVPGTWYNMTTGTSASGLNWQSIFASSQDGTKLVAAVSLGDIWVSNDSGVTWTNRTTGTAASGFNWQSIASSADGTKFAATAYGGDIWTSSDSGVTWVNRTVGTAGEALAWTGITSSADGTKLAATVPSGDIWTSTDSGVTWTNQTTGTGASGLVWTYITSSADGTRLAAIEQSTNNIWTSTDSGVTWTNKTDGTTAADHHWQSITSSADGTKLAAAVNNGDIWTSADSGATWINRTTGTSASGLYWLSIASSADGTRLAAADGIALSVWISTDSGVTWRDTTTGVGNGSWIAVVGSSDFSHLAAITEHEDIWTTTLDFIPPSISDLVASTSDVEANFVWANLTWTTDVPADSFVLFGHTDAYGRVLQESDLVTDHSLPINNLMCGTTYHYTIISHTPGGGQAATADQTFTTSACVPWRWYDITSGTEAANQQWTAITSSADGTKLAATAIFGDIWTSTDSGVTWVNKTLGSNASNLAWSSITSSADGTKLAAVAQSGGLWTSGDSGNTWVQRTEGVQYAVDAAFTASYYDNANLSGSPVLTQSDTTINNEWGFGSPDSSVPTDYFSAHWEGTLTIPHDGTYTFSTINDDGMRVWINGVKVIDDWNDHPATANSYSTTTLTQGQVVPIVIEYFDNAGSAVARFAWSDDGSTVNDAANWAAVTSSADGTKLAAAERISGDIWTSIDSGVTWVDRTVGTGASGLSWNSITSSADGTKLAAVDGGGDIWTSSDSAATWVNRTTGTDASGRYWRSITSSSDGTRLAAVIDDGGGLWISTDSGVTWVNKAESNSLQSYIWTSITSSADGMKLAATVDGGDVWASVDGGDTWVNQTEDSEASGVAWTGITTPADGLQLFAVAYGNSIWKTTLDLSVPALSNIIITPNATSVVFTWQTDMLASGTVVYGLTDAYGATTTEDGGASFSHEVTLNGLACNTTYHYRIISTSHGNKTAQSEGTFATDANCGDWRQSVSGVEAGKIAISRDGTKLAFIDYDSNSIYYSMSSGAVWASTTPNAQLEQFFSLGGNSDLSTVYTIGSDGATYSTHDFVSWQATSATQLPELYWSGIAASANGMKLAVTQGGGDVWTSQDGGATWRDNPRPLGEPFCTYGSIVSSADGTVLAFSDNDCNGHIYLSTDAGVTWSNVTATGDVANVYFRDIALSADGTKIAAIMYGGDIWTSTDSGATWTNQTEGTGASGQPWISITSSQDGTKLAATVSNTDIWTSTDSGATWTNQTEGTGASGMYWQSITSSQDGTKLAAGTSADIWTSTDSGVTWTNQTTGTDASGSVWRSITSSADGTKLAAVSNTDIWTSTDSGVTWIERTADINLGGGFEKITSSADGTKLIAVGPYTGVWMSVDSGVTWTHEVGAPGWGNLEVVGDALWGIGYSSGLLRTSADGGHTWSEVIPTAVTIPRYTTVRSAVKGTVLVEYTADTLYFSTDGGSTWASHTGQNDYAGGWSSIQLNQEGTTLFASSDSDCSYFVSQDFGVTWEQMSGLGSADCQQIGISDDGQSVLSADLAVNGSLLVSADGGEHVEEVAYPTNRQYWSSLTVSGDGALLAALSWPEKTLWIRVATTSVATRLALANTTSVQLQGEITNTGGEVAYERGFVWGETTSYGNTITQTGSFTNLPFSSTLTNLVCGVTYHYAAFARNTVGTGYGADQTFSLESCNAPSGASSGPGIKSRPVATSTPPVHTSGGTLSTRPSVPAKTPVSPTRVPGNLHAPLSGGVPGATTTATSTTKLPRVSALQRLVAQAITKNLRYGDTGAEVLALQKALNLMGYTLAKSGAGSPGKETSCFGPLTYKAVVAFQKKYGLPKTGYFGPLTRQKLVEMVVQ